MGLIKPLVNPSLLRDIWGASPNEASGGKVTSGAIPKREMTFLSSPCPGLCMMKQVQCVNVAMSADSRRETCLKLPVTSQVHDCDKCQGTLLCLQNRVLNISGTFRSVFRTFCFTCRFGIKNVSANFVLRRCRPNNVASWRFTEKPCTSLVQNGSLSAFWH